MAASSDAVAQAADPKPDASGRRLATLTSLAVLVLIYQRHFPEPLLNGIWIKDALNYVEMTLGALLLGQQARIVYCGVRTGVRKAREFGRATIAFVRATSAIRITLEPPRGDD